MIIIFWIALGLVVGLITTTLSVGPGRLEDTIVAVVGSVSGGWLFVLLTGAEVMDVTPRAAAAGLAGAALLLALSRVLARRQETI